MGFFCLDSWPRGHRPEWRGRDVERPSSAQLQNHIVFTLCFAHICGKNLLSFHFDSSSSSFLLSVRFLDVWPWTLYYPFLFFSPFLSFQMSHWFTLSFGLRQCISPILSTPRSILIESLLVSAHIWILLLSSPPLSSPLFFSSFPSPLTFCLSPFVSLPMICGYNPELSRIEIPIFFFYSIFSLLLNFGFFFSISHFIRVHIHCIYNQKN